MKKSKSVADYIRASGQWTEELRSLRAVLKSTELEETIKWGAPCYTYQGKNVVGLASYTDYFGLWFHQGAMLKDASKKLINAQEGKTRALRQWRMSKASDIKPSIIRRYVKESMVNIDNGIAIKPVKAKSVSVPSELQTALAKNKKLKIAFDKLTPGKQREYSTHLHEARQATTRERRLKKMLPLILAGKGLNDRYR